jgi:isopentenyl phosphate kinase
MKRPPLVFLKLGGSLLGDKSKPRSFRAKTLGRIGAEIGSALKASPPISLLIGHGGGGAAHYPAKTYRTRDGLPGGGGWRGFAETRRGVLTMNTRVLKALAGADLHPILIPPVAGVLARNGKIKTWDTSVIEATLKAGQIPMIHGDVVIDKGQGFTICSTEALFDFLVESLEPARIVLASDVEGVYLESSSPVVGVETRPLRQGVEVIKTITPANRTAVRRAMKQSGVKHGSKRVYDVTGGMVAKVEHLAAMNRRHPKLETQIISGLVPGAVEAALRGETVGTVIA